MKTEILLTFNKAAKVWRLTITATTEQSPFVSISVNNYEAAEIMRAFSLRKNAYPSPGFEVYQ